MRWRNVAVPAPPRVGFGVAAAGAVSGAVCVYGGVCVDAVRAGASPPAPPPASPHAPYREWNWDAPPPTPVFDAAFGAAGAPLRCEKEAATSFAVNGLGGVEPMDLPSDAFAAGHFAVPHMLIVETATGAVHAPSPQGQPPRRAFHAQAAGPSNTVVLHGGRGARGDVLQDMWVFDCETRAWQEFVSPAKLWRHGLAVTEDWIVLVGGDAAADDASPLGRGGYVTPKPPAVCQVHMWEVSVGRWRREWTALPDAPCARLCPCVAAAARNADHAALEDAVVYVVGGCDAAGEVGGCHGRSDVLTLSVPRTDPRSALRPDRVPHPAGAAAEAGEQAFLSTVHARLRHVERELRRREADPRAAAWEVADLKAAARCLAQQRDVLVAQQTTGPRPLLQRKTPRPPSQPAAPGPPTAHPTPSLAARSSTPARSDVLGFDQHPARLLQLPTGSAARDTPLEMQDSLVPLVARAGDVDVARHRAAGHLEALLAGIDGL
eukprot:TRINITY_DN4570_c0_g1_i3.p1 TRINITY_DN4570_c0_g1~~TRINITY_DN4570_c0_g1_i3.p1  ORF type:complete len:491 (+),score=108.83 TRINITY_DN4570_c0_g1_i3:381-1853(+)